MGKRRKRNSGHTTEKSKKPQLAPSASSQLQSIRQPLNLAPKIGNHTLFLFVGPQRELITIHTDLLPEKTVAYIHAQNYDQVAYQLPNEDPVTFHLYRLWLYNSKIYSLSDTNLASPDDGRSLSHPDGEWTKLAHCHMLATTLGDERFANAAIDALFDKMREIERFPTGIASEVYNLTAPGDKLRKLIVDLHVWYGMGTCIQAPHDDAKGPAKFLGAVISGLAAAGMWLYSDEIKEPWHWDICEYHAHEVTKKCAGKTK